jgi:hypothetical protein
MKKKKRANSLDTEVDSEPITEEVIKKVIRLTRSQIVTHALLCHGFDCHTKLPQGFKLTNDPDTAAEITLSYRHGGGDIVHITLFPNGSMEKLAIH